jgi:hypothetical protein
MTLIWNEMAALCKSGFNKRRLLYGKARKITAINAFNAFNAFGFTQSVK